MLDAVCKGVPMGFGIGLLALIFAGCSAQQWADTMSRVREVKEIMSGTCVRGESWEACIQKCEHATVEPQGGGGSQ